MYWTPAQQLAHLTVNGASRAHRRPVRLRHGLRARTRDQAGSFLELTWNGTEPVTLADGSTRAFLADGDTVTISGTAPGAGRRAGSASAR